VAGQDHRVIIHGQQAFDDAQLPHALDLRPVQIGPVSAARLALYGKPHNPIRADEGIRVDQRRIDDAKHRRCGSNTEYQ
jgi:hypothetical protein